jgi:hypothetical protein
VLHVALDPGEPGSACISTGRIRAVPSQSPLAAHPRAAVVGPTTSADVQALVTSLESAVHVVFTPMPDLVARLETGGPVPVLHLDRDSPPEDHRWALWEVLRFLALGLAATDAAVAVPRLRLVRD